MSVLNVIPVVGDLRAELYDAEKKSIRYVQVVAWQVSYGSELRPFMLVDGFVHLPQELREEFRGVYPFGEIPFVTGPSK